MISKEKIKSLLRKGIKFLQSSLAAFVTNISVLTFCVEILHFPAPLAYGLAIACATTAGFLVCRFFVFKDNEHENIFRQYAKFVSSSLVFRLIEFGVFTVFVEIFNFYYLYVFLVVQILGTIAKFFFYSKFIFERKQ